MKKCAECGAMLLTPEETYESDGKALCGKCAEEEYKIIHTKQGDIKIDNRGRWLYSGGSLIICSKCGGTPFVGKHMEIFELPCRCPLCNTQIKNVREL